MSITSLPLPSNLTSDLANVQIVNIIDQLPVNSHYSWAEKAGVRSPSALTTQGIHHDGISKASVAQWDDIQLATIIANNHIRSTKNHPEGDPGFPYHIWIRSGIIYLCNDLTVRTYGISDNNGYIVHISVAGDYKYYDVLTDDDRKALYAAMLAVKKALPDCVIIKGHNQFVKTDCPGFNMDQVRNDVFSIEQKAIFEQSEAYTKETAFKIANQTMYLYNMAQGKLPDGSRAEEGQVGWAVDMLLKMYPFMQENRLFG